MLSYFRHFAVLLGVLLSWLPIHSVAADGVLLVENSHIIQPPPGAEVAAGFMHLVNPGDTDVVLLGADSDAFGHVEIHESVVDNDVAKMIKQSELVIPAGGSVELKHGGYHLMLMGIKKPLKPDQEIPLLLSSSAGEVHVTLKVIGAGHNISGSHSHNEQSEDKTKTEPSHNMKHGSGHGSKAHKDHKDAN